MTYIAYGLALQQGLYEWWAFRCGSTIRREDNWTPSNTQQEEVSETFPPDESRCRLVYDMNNCLKKVPLRTKLSQLFSYVFYSLVNFE